VIAPIYQELASKYHSTPAGSNVHHGRQSKVKDIKFIKVDTATSMELSQRYQIRATPTFKFFINKKEVSAISTTNKVHTQEYSQKTC
jgi:thiol-disulfide isomerase/thioredoxin